MKLHITVSFKEATKRRTKLEIILNVNRATIPFVISLIEPMLKKYILIRNEYKTINNLIDLDIQDTSELSSLGNEIADLLERKHKILDSYNDSSHMLERVMNFILDLYVDYHKLKGNDVKQNVTKLKDLIENYKNETLVDFILSETPDESLS